MDPTRRVPHRRRLSVPNDLRFNRSRVNTFRRRRQPISRAALKSLAPLNLDIPASSVTPPESPPSLYLVVLSHLAELEARLHSSASSSALQLLHQLRDEVVTFFPGLDEDQAISPPEGLDPLEYDFEYDFGFGSTFNFSSALDLDLDLNLSHHYALLTEELSTLSLEEAKNKLCALSTQRYDDAKHRFNTLVEAKNRFVGEVRRWADGVQMPALPNIPTLPNVHMPTFSGHMPDLSVPRLHARLDELRAALPADLCAATDKLASFVESLIEDDADGDVSWVDTRWKGLNIHPRGETEASGKGKEPVDMHALAMEKSAFGRRLIRYSDLPEKWRNNEFVLRGYRFIPGARWGALVWSMFQLHNETVNIQTHLLPLLAILSIIPVPWAAITNALGVSSIWNHPFLSTSINNLHPHWSQLTSIDPTSFIPTNLTSLSFEGLGFTPLPPSPADTLPKALFLLAAGACLTCSTIWHTLAGCSDFWLLEAGARVDYVGIGWLISASVSGVMYYGFACQPAIMRFYISIAISTGIAGSILPFQAWFNERRNKKWRIAFFLLCACSAIVPLGHMSYKHSFGRMWEFIGPLVPSLVSYLTGLAFYATHFPECCFPGRFDWAGSHAIWHVFIVIGELCRFRRPRRVLVVRNEMKRGRTISLEGVTLVPLGGYARYAIDYAMCTRKKKDRCRRLSFLGTGWKSRSIGIWLLSHSWWRLTQGGRGEHIW